MPEGERVSLAQHLMSRNERDKRTLTPDCDSSSLVDGKSEDNEGRECLVHFSKRESGSTQLGTERQAVKTRLIGARDE